MEFGQFSSGPNEASHQETGYGPLHTFDLVITADIPLAALVIEKGGHALNPRGEFYTTENIRERLAMRNFMDELRNTGVNTGGPAVLSLSDRQAFANQLDRFLTKTKG